jgi:hypothetical protein
MERAEGRGGRGGRKGRKEGYKLVTSGHSVRKQGPSLRHSEG